MKTHPMRWDALVFGVLFAVIVMCWALVAGGAATVADLRIIGPVALIVAGVAGIALTLRRSS